MDTVTVTFGPDWRDGDVRGYYVKCEGSVIDECVTYVEARTAAETHGKRCGDCGMIGAEIEPITDVPTMNINNTNAYRILSALGADVRKSCDLSGEMRAESLAAHIELALKIDDSEVRDPYMQSRLRELLNIAQWAQRAGRLVTWA